MAVEVSGRDDHLTIAQETRDKIVDRPIVVSVSGGKDSTAVALLLMREWKLPSVTLIHAETGWEAPTHEGYMSYLEETLGQKIVRLKSPVGTMVDLVRKKAMFPSRLKRFCTQQLKVFPIKDYLETIDCPVNAVGIRAAESNGRSILGEWDRFVGLEGCLVWRPIIRWSAKHVVDLHQRYGVLLNPLYGLGASRVGCWPCIYARKAEFGIIAKQDPARIAELRELEREITVAADERAARRGEINKHPRTWFNGGRAGMMPIDDVILWSKTSHGGRQFELFAPIGGEHPCAKWGYCETWDDSEDSSCGG